MVHTKRSTSTKTNFIGLGLGAVIFAIAVASPKIIEKFSSGSNDDEALKVTKVKLDKIPPKEKEKPKEIPKTPPPPQPPPIDQVKFVKPVVVKKEDVTEEIQKIDDLKDKKVADKDVKGDPTKDFDMSNDYGKGDERSHHTNSTTIPTFKPQAAISIRLNQKLRGSPYKCHQLSLQKL